MKLIKGVIGGKEQAVPLVIGLDTVYVHTNIRKIESEDMPDAELYEYDEEQYDLLEFIASNRYDSLVKSDKQDYLIKSLSSKVEMLQVQSDMDRRALLEVIEVIYSSMEV